MKKINTTPIISGSAMPVKSGSLEHLQSSYQECLIDIIQTLIAQTPSPGFPVFSAAHKMYGALRSGVSPAIISQGVIAFGSEIYRAPGATVVLGFGEVVIGTITTTYLTATNADPVTFSDGTSNNVHEIRQVIWSNGVSGSGDFDFDDVLNFGRWIPVTYNAGYLTAASGTWTIASSADWDVKYRRLGATITIDYNIVLGTTSASTASLTLNLPISAVWAGDFYAACILGTGNASPMQNTVGRCHAVAGTTTLNFIIMYAAAPAFDASAGGISVYGQISVEVEQ